MQPTRLKYGLLVVLILILLSAYPQPPATAGVTDRPAGLMWNRTGLPAVFPLQVKTPKGHDYVVTLSDAETGQPALAAYIKGGAFFRILVPPGVFHLQFASGTTWQDEENLFGAGNRTQVFTLAAPLTFETRGAAIKAGHIVDISHAPAETGTGASLDIDVAEQLICQSARLRFSRTRHIDPPSDYFDPAPDASGTYRLDQNREVYSRFCDE